MDAITQALQLWLHEAAHAGSLSSLFLSLALAYAGGVLSSLTPCIYPMIPITIGVVGGMPNISDKHHHADPAASVFFRGLAYVCGMALVYAVLGVFAGITGKVFGTITNTRGWYIALGLIMTFSALMMLDIIKWDPQATLDRLNHILGFHLTKRKTHTEATWIGAFGLGATSGFIAAPCTTPVLTAILGFIAQTQSVVLGMLVMIFFAFGLGTLLLLIALFASGLRNLPRAGHWMNVIKVLSGVLILGFAEYLFFRAGEIG